MSIAASMTALPRPGYTLGVFDSDILEQRIRRLLHRPAANLKRARLLLAAGLSALALCAVIASGVALTARAQTADRADIDARVKAARVLLDNAMSKPGDTELISQVRQALLDILARDSANQEALNGMMTLSVIAKQPAEGRQWALKMVALYPKEKTAYYSVGFTDWSIVYPAMQAVRTAAGMRPEDTHFIADAAARRSLHDQYGALIDEGMHMLDTAIQMDPNYADAMAYLNLMYRLQANIADNAAEAAKAISEADEWVGKALAAKRLAAASPSSAGTWVAAPPPPPPPPPPPYFSDSALASDAPMPARHDRAGTYWQVMGATGAPARKLIVELNIAGFPAGSYMTGSDSAVRVIVGPYPDDTSLAAARSKLEAAGYRVIRSW
jgi:cell division septation protein DedD